MADRPNVLFLMDDEHRPDVLFDLATDPGETANLLDDPGYADAVEEFRARRRTLAYGPDAVADYTDAGYEPGVDAAR